VTERARKRAFALAVLAVGCTLVLLTSMRPQPDRHAASRPASADRGTDTARRRATIQDPVAFERAPGAAGREAGAGQPERSRSARLHAGARRHARAFLRVLFRYEVGDASPGMRAAIQALADARLARVLLTSSPRPPRSGRFPPPARLVRFVREHDAPDGAVDVSAQIVRGDRPSRIAVRVEWREGRWLATAVG
jgi:hypothetical protein